MFFGISKLQQPWQPQTALYYWASHRTAPSKWRKGTPSEKPLTKAKDMQNKQNNHDRERRPADSLALFLLLLNFSDLQFAHLQNGDTAFISIDCMKLLT